jgi:hypothetical protein
MPVGACGSRLVNYRTAWYGVTLLCLRCAPLHKENTGLAHYRELLSTCSQTCSATLQTSPLTHPSAGPHSGRRSLVQSDIPPKRGRSLPTPGSLHAAIIKFLDSAETAKRIVCCPKCSSPVEYRASLLIFEGRSWNMALPVCPLCNAKPHRA